MTLLLSATPKYLLRVHSTRVGFVSARRRSVRGGPGRAREDRGARRRTRRRVFQRTDVKIASAARRSTGGSTGDERPPKQELLLSQLLFHFINYRIDDDARHLATSKLSDARYLATSKLS